MKYFIHILLFFTLTGCAGNIPGDDLASVDPTGESVNIKEVSDTDSFLDDDFDDLDDFDDFGGEVADLPSYSDPLEPMNRLFFSFNDKQIGRAHV